MENLREIPTKYPEGVKDIQQFPLTMLERVNPEAIEKQLAGDEVLQKLWESVKDLALEYLVDVCRFVQANERIKAGGSIDDFEDASTNRTYKHEAFISSLTALARNMSQKGMDASWLEKFNDNRIMKGTWALQYALKLIQAEIEETEKQSREHLN